MTSTNPTTSHVLGIRDDHIAASRATVMDLPELTPGQLVEYRGVFTRTKCKVVAVIGRRNLDGKACRYRLQVTATKDPLWKRGDIIDTERNWIATR